LLKFYFNASPNPAQVALFLEESGLPYTAIPIDTRKGEQFGAEFVASGHPSQRAEGSIHIQSRNGRRRPPNYVSTHREGVNPSARS
jgi:hypothetical protein